MKKLFILFLFAFLSFFCAAFPAYGQQHGPNIPFQIIDTGPGGNTAPIGGLAILAALGGGYAIKKLRDTKSKE